MTEQATEGRPSDGSPLPDVVYPYRHSSDDGELRHSLRSIEANLPHRKVWIVGERPDWIVNVHHIRRPNNHGDRYRNALEHVRAAAAQDDLAARFVLMNDDFYVLQPTTFETMPILHRGPISEAHKKGTSGRDLQNRTGSPWHRGIWDTRAMLERWGFEDPLSYELHVPLPIETKPFAEILERAHAQTDWGARRSLQMRSLYGNAAGLGGTQSADVKIGTMGRQTFTPGQLFVSTSNRAFVRGKIGADLRSLFPTPSRYEKPA